MQDEAILINQVLKCDRYIAEVKINEGSYGQIFKVRSKINQQWYALKAMELQKLSKMNKMHESAVEQLILSKLRHSGIIRLFQTIQAPNYVGLVLQLCPFGDIFQLMRTVNKHFELAFKKKRIMIYYFAQIVQALDYLHSNGIVHRDIKPENIVLGRDLRIRLIDFGTAKIQDECPLVSIEELYEIERLREKSDLTLPEEEKDHRQSFVGTTNYLSPESISMQYSTKSDIWALGILAYKFYFNKLPYQGKDSVEIFTKIKINDVPIEKGVEPEFEQFFKLTLAKKAEDRPSARQLKKIKLFEGIDFKTIFSVPPPIVESELNASSQQSPKKKIGKFLFEKALQKKMFFGNYKPRYLTIEKIESNLIMAYRYIPSKKVKNEFELYLNDYAVSTKKNEFEVVTSDKRYGFRVGKNDSTGQVVEEINSVIRSSFALE